MPCLICGEPALVVDIDDEDYEEGSCPKCGHYRITDTALMQLKAKNWCFDLLRVRKWIAERQGPGRIPVIDTDQAVRLIDA